jgi:integrase
MALWLVRDEALVFGDHEGRQLHPERFSGTFKAALTRCLKALGDAAPPEIRLHDLRHTHATLLQTGRVASGVARSSTWCIRHGWNTAGYQ